MGFYDLINTCSTTALGKFGESVTLDCASSSVTTLAIVDRADPNAELLVPGISTPSYVLTLAAEDAGQVTPDWTVVVRGERREVLANPPAQQGLSIVYLGDAC